MFEAHSTSVDIGFRVYGLVYWLLSCLPNTVFLCLRVWRSECSLKGRSPVNCQSLDDHIHICVLACAVVDIGNIFYDHFMGVSYCLKWSHAASQTGVSITQQFGEDGSGERRRCSIIRQRLHLLKLETCY